MPAARLTRRYFRQWFYWHGKTYARILGDVFPEVDIATGPSFAGVPRFLYRQALEQCWRYLRSLAAGDALASLTEELRTLQYAGLFLDRWRGIAQRPTPIAAKQA